MFPDGTVHHKPRCSMPALRGPAAWQSDKAPSTGALQGWQVWTTFQHPSNASFTSFVGSFTVPTAPTQQDGATVFIFFGLQSDNWVPIENEPSPPSSFDIIQPVLQFGPSSGGGGEDWNVASWYVTLDDSYLVTPMVKVNAGDSIAGNMTQTGPQTWFIGATMPNKAKANLSVTRPRLSSQPWAYNTLEAYSIDACADFPPTGASSVFTKLALTDAHGSITPTWTLNQNTQHCTAKVASSSPAAVTISW